MNGTPEVGTHALSTRLSEVEARVGVIRNVAPTPDEPVMIEANDNLLLVDGSAYSPLVMEAQEQVHLVSPSNQFTLTIGEEETVPIDPAPVDWANDYWEFTQAIDAALTNLTIIESANVMATPGFDPGEVIIDMYHPASPGELPDMELTGGATGGSVEVTIQAAPEVPEQPLNLIFPENTTGFIDGQELTVVLTVVPEDSYSGVYFQAENGELLGDIEDQSLSRRGASVVILYLGDNVWTTVSRNDF